MAPISWAKHITPIQEHIIMVTTIASAMVNVSKSCSGLLPDLRDKVPSSSH